MTRPTAPAASLQELELRLEYEFRRPELLTEALTHRSHHGAGGGSETDNERFEFLGDAIVGFVVSDAVCSLFPALDEGRLSRIKSNLVSRRSLTQVAERLELGRFLRLGPGEEKTGGREKQALLANALEAVVAALYRDGGLAAARRFLETNLLDALDSEAAVPLARADFKSALQEHLQGHGLPPARYAVAEARGPEHRKTFRIELRIGDQPCAEGLGPTKKAAEQMAARAALEKLRLVPPAGASAEAR